jgi:hypothetical protein
MRAEAATEDVDMFHPGSSRILAICLVRKNSLFAERPPEYT